jgi:hypothetical protein
MAALPVAAAHDLAAAAPDRAWLVRDLWSEGAVGFIGGEPKSYKSFLALSLAVAVASGQPCLRRFAVAQPGPVLLFPAEDQPGAVRRRLDGLCAWHGARLAELPLWVITAPVVRLDREPDRQALADTVAQYRPRLLILDPFVRLHQRDENCAAEIAPLLAFLRSLQRRYAAAVLVVHHARKGAAQARGGQALRGTSEFHAWADSSLLLCHTAAGLRLSAEHRDHPSDLRLPLRALQTEAGTVLAVAGDAPSPAPAAAPAPPQQQVLAALRRLEQPHSLRQLREQCRMRTATLSQALHELAAQGLACQGDGGWRAAPEPAAPVSRLAVSLDTGPETPRGNTSATAAAGLPRSV